MPWVLFSKAEQATPGARMRPERYIKKKGRPKSLVVKERKTTPYLGNVLYFTDGNHIKLSEANMFRWEVFVKDDEKQQ